MNENKFEEIENLILLRLPQASHIDERTHLINMARIEVAGLVYSNVIEMPIARLLDKLLDLHLIPSDNGEIH